MTRRYGSNVNVASIIVIVRPGFTDWMTAVGTVAVAVAAVGVAFVAEWRAGVRVRAERTRSDKVLADERTAADARLKAEQDHSDSQLREERRLAEEREQLAGAYAIQVTPARMFGESTKVDDVYSEPVGPESTRPVAIVVNRSDFTVTGVEAQFCLPGNVLIPAYQTQRKSSYLKLHNREGLSGPLGDDAFNEVRPGNPTSVTITPADMGVRFIFEERAPDNLLGAYPVVRWTDRWEQRWEHRQGVVEKLPDGAPWRVDGVR